MVLCLGHRQGTGCYHRSRNRQMRENWEKFQLCYKCARILHPAYYKDKKNHGVKTTPTLAKRYNTTPFVIDKMNEEPLTVAVITNKKNN